MLPAGSRLGPYEITAPLQLGADEAYRAYEHGQERLVILHVFRVEFDAEPERRSAFERQIHAAAALSHPHILETYDAGTDAHAAYVVSAPATGDTLRARLDAGTVSPGDAVRWAVQITRALAAARRRGVPHGHLSADRVVLDAAGRALVSGFGVAPLVPPYRRATDARALIALTGALLRSAWQATPLRRRAAWSAAAAAAAVLALVIASTVGRDVTATDQPGTATVAAGNADRAVLPEGTPVQAEEPPPDVPSTPQSADASGAAEPIGAPAVSAPPSAPIAGARPAPAPSPPSPKPSSPPAELPPPATAPAAPVRPLTPVVADGRNVPSLVTEASVRANEFDLAGAAELLKAAASRGDVGAQAAALYLGGLLDAREAFLEGGPANTIAPIHDAIMSLQGIAKGRPGSAEIARLMLHAAAAAAQSERDEMSLYLETALEMESLQRMAGLPGAPLVSAAEVAGDLWLQVHRYEDARGAYTEAAARVGSTLRILSGLARAARRLNDTPAACATYRRLLDAWGGRPGLPVEIAEARAYVGGCAP